MNTSPHHQHIRKRIYKNLEEFPHPNKGVRLLDKGIYVVGAIMPLATIPQIYKIFNNHDASNISIISWFTYFIFSIIWLVYGVVHKEIPLIFTNILWVIMNGLVLLGILIY